MLGESIGTHTGRLTAKRVLPHQGHAPKVEVTYEAKGELLGLECKEIGTYIATARPDGTYFGEGQGLAMGKNGEVATWKGQGLGKPTPSGGFSWRGCLYYETGANNLARLNSTAVVFEFEVDADDNTSAKIFEWR